MDIITDLYHKRGALIKRYKDLAEVESVTDNQSAQLAEIEKEIQAINARIDALVAAQNMSDEHENQGKQSRGRVSTPSLYVHQGGFSISRAIRSMVEYGRVDGMEGSISDQYGSGRVRRANAFYLPLHTRANETNRTSASGLLTQGYGELLPLLRSKSIAAQLGVRFVTDLQGAFRIPVQSGGVTASWVAEGSSVANSQVTVPAVELVPQQLTAMITFSRQLLSQSSYVTDEMLMTDLVSAIAAKLDSSVFNGTGAGAEPEGFLVNSSVEQVALAGASVTYADLLKLQRKVKDQSPTGTLRHAVSPKGEETLSQIARIGTTYPSFCLENGEVNGFEALVSKNIPDTFSTTKTVCMFGDFERAGTVGFWSNATEIVVDPYTRADYSEIRLVAYLTCNFKVVDPNLVKFVAF